MTGRAGIVEERPVRLEVNGRALGSWTASPGQEEALAAGRLLADGWIRNRSDLLALDVLDEGAGIVIRAHVPVGCDVTGEEVRALRSSGGFPALIDWLQAKLPRGPGSGRAPLPPLDSFPALFRQLFGGAGLSRETGGFHSAALCDGTELLHHVDDIARHSALDKVIGLAVLAGDDLSHLGLVVSARISGEMALKCAAANIAWIASRSVPTTLAVDVAEAVGMPIVARAPSPQAAVLAGPPDAGTRPGADAPTSGEPDSPPHFWL